MVEHGTSSGSTCVRVRGPGKCLAFSASPLDSWPLVPVQCPSLPGQVSYFLNLSKALLIWDSILLDAHIGLSHAELLVSRGAICWTLADYRKQG